VTVRPWTAAAIEITVLAAAGCSYYVFFKSGTGWDAAHRRFTEACAYERYDDRFDGSFDWSISLARTPLGNAPTSEVDAF
jgi:hypothetical protein